MENNNIYEIKNRLEKRRREREISFTRATVSRKPQLQYRELKFLKNTLNNKIFALLIGDNKVDSENSLLKNENALKAESVHKLRYKIVGGIDHNAMLVYLNKDKLDNSKHGIKWIGLLTFTGFQFKYVIPGKKKFSFALADEDAYQYCDKNPCEECVFKCKNGFKLYLYCEKHGLFWTEISARSIINK